MAPHSEEANLLTRVRRSKRSRSAAISQEDAPSASCTTQETVPLQINSARTTRGGKRPRNQKHHETTAAGSSSGVVGVSSSASDSVQVNARPRQTPHVCHPSRCNHVASSGAASQSASALERQMKHRSGKLRVRIDHSPATTTHDHENEVTEEALVPMNFKAEKRLATAVAENSSELCSTADFECALCLNLLFNPVSLLCGHSYCFHCLRLCVLHGQRRRCATCRTDFPLALMQNLKPNLILQSLIARLFPKELEQRRLEVSDEGHKTDWDLTQLTLVTDQGMIFPGQSLPLILSSEKISGFLELMLTLPEMNGKRVCGHVGPPQVFDVDPFGGIENGSIGVTMLVKTHCYHADEGRLCIELEVGSRFEVVGKPSLSESDFASCLVALTRRLDDNADPEWLGRLPKLPHLEALVKDARGQYQALTCQKVADKIVAHGFQMYTKASRKLRGGIDRLYGQPPESDFTKIGFWYSGALALGIEERGFLLQTTSAKDRLMLLLWILEHRDCVKFDLKLARRRPRTEQEGQESDLYETDDSSSSSRESEEEQISDARVETGEDPHGGPLHVNDASGPSADGPETQNRAASDTTDAPRARLTSLLPLAEAARQYEEEEEETADEDDASVLDFDNDGNYGGSDDDEISSAGATRQDGDEEESLRRRLERYRSRLWRD